MLRPDDTSPEAWAVYVEKMSALNTGERLQMISDWYEFTRALRFAGLKKLHPGASDEQIGRMFLAEILHRDSHS